MYTPPALGLKNGISPSLDTLKIGYMPAKNIKILEDTIFNDNLLGGVACNRYDEVNIIY